MKKILAFVAGTVLLTGLSAHGAGQTEGRNDRDTVLDRVNRAFTEAAKATGSIKDWGTPRTVPRGTAPEIILDGGQVIIGGKRLEVGQSFDKWAAVLPGKRRCDDLERPAACVWDDLGISIVLWHKDRKIVQEVNISLVDPEPSTPNVIQPLKRFPGYIELDGFGIDAQTKFWEVRKMAKKERNLKCGLRDCVMPHGAFGAGSWIYFELVNHSESGTVKRISIDTIPDE